MKTGSAGLSVAFYLVKKRRKKQEQSLREHVQNYRCDPPLPLTLPSAEKPFALLQDTVASQ